MRFLFIHQNFPAQFRHLAKKIADDPRHEVVAVGESRNMRVRPSLHPRVRILDYTPHRQAHASTHHYLRDFESHVCRGQSVASLLLQLKGNGFSPDVIMAHPGWGEALFLRDVYPDAKHIYYFEYYYHGVGGDVGFDPEFPSTLDSELKVRMKNSTQLHALINCDMGLSPTVWQKSRYPQAFHEKIHVVHEGVDTNAAQPDPHAWIEIGERRFQAGDPVITYVARNLEPYRGFHSLMRSLKDIQKRCPLATVIIVGGDDVSYGSRLPNGQTYRSLFTAEVSSLVDWTKVLFIPRLSYADYLRLLQVSAAHVYLTYPFVLSWSLLEAMSAGCAVVASKTTPVEEVITDGKEGRLFNFFDYDGLARTIEEVLHDPDQSARMRQAARQAVQSRFDLQTVCLPEVSKLLGI